MPDFAVKMVRNLSQKEEAKLRVAGCRHDAGGREEVDPLRRVVILDVEHDAAAKALVIDVLGLSGSDAIGLKASRI